MALTKIDDRGLTTPIDLLDNEKIRFGTGNDLQIHHSGSHSFINNATGQLQIQTDTFGVTPADASEYMLYASKDGAANLYYDGSKKLETTSYGNLSTGTLQVTGNLELYDNYKALFGTGSDLQIYHDGSDSYIKHNGTGNFYVQTSEASVEDLFLQAGNDVYVRVQTGDTAIKAIGDAAVELYYDNSKKFATTSEGTATTGRATITYTGNAGKPTLTLGADNSQGSTSLTNSTSKGARVGVYHYTNAEEPANIFYAVGSDTSNQINYGGGTSYMNAATHHKFFTADDITTTAGTERLRIDGNGRVSINTDTPHCANLGVHIKTGDSGVTSASTNRDDIFIEGSDHAGITISTANNKTGGIGFDDPDGAGRGRIQYSHSSDKMQIYTSGTNSFEFTDDLDILDGDLRVANGHGINFSSTSHVTGVESELLDDYESGTWTADVATGTCSQQSCNYVKVGSLVHIWGRIHGLSDTTTNIILKFTGLPYTCSTSNAGGSKFSKDISTDANTAYITTAEDLTFYGHNSANAWSYVTHLSCGSNTEIYFHASYTSDTN